MGIQSTLTIKRSYAVYLWQQKQECRLTNEELENFLEETFDNYTVLDDDLYEEIRKEKEIYE